MDYNTLNSIRGNDEGPDWRETFKSFIYVVAWIVFIGVIIAMCSCTTTRYVTVPEIHTEYVHRTDSVHQVDSIIREKETTVMQLDSAAMAQYGIRLEKAERAWLVKTKELERELQRIAQMKADTIIKVDSIPYPVDRLVEVEKKLSWWQQTRMHLGEALLAVLLIAAGWWIFKKRAWWLSLLKKFL